MEMAAFQCDHSITRADCRRMVLANQAQQDECPPTSTVVGGVPSLIFLFHVFYFHRRYEIQVKTVRRRVIPLPGGMRNGRSVRWLWRRDETHQGEMGRLVARRSDWALKAAYATLAAARSGCAVICPLSEASCIILYAPHRHTVSSGRLAIDRRRTVTMTPGSGSRVACI